jgi:hypothetical protein
MNERIKELMGQTLDEKFAGTWSVMDLQDLTKFADRFAELIVGECIGILETEIELVEGYKSTACNDFDEVWHQGKIEHFTKLVKKSKKHFGVEE